MQLLSPHKRRRLDNWCVMRLTQSILVPVRVPLLVPGAGLMGPVAAGTLINRRTINVCQGEFLLLFLIQHSSWIMQSSIDLWGYFKVPHDGSDANSKANCPLIFSPRLHRQNRIKCLYDCEVNARLAGTPPSVQIMQTKVRCVKMAAEQKMNSVWTEYRIKWCNVQFTDKIILNMFRLEDRWRSFWWVSADVRSNVEQQSAHEGHVLLWRKEM